MCLFLSNLKVVFDTAILIKHEYCPTSLKAYIGITLPLTPARDILYVCVFVESFFVSNADNMLRLNKKELTAMAKKMKVAPRSSPAKELKMKAVVAVAASDDEDTCSSSKEEGKLPLSPPSTQSLMVGLLRNASLYLVPPLLETLWYTRVGEKTFKRADCGIHPWMPLLSLRKPYFLLKPW